MDPAEVGPEDGRVLSSISLLPRWNFIYRAHVPLFTATFSAERASVPRNSKGIVGKQVEKWIGRDPGFSRKRLNYVAIFRARFGTMG